LVLLLSVLLFVFLSTVVVDCHVCILQPHQRGNLSILQPGDPSCFRRTPYCGGIPEEDPQVQYAESSWVTMEFQQNLNHWYPGNPGMFDISLSFDSNPSDDSWITLLTIPDYAAHDMVTQTNFSATFLLPSGTTSHGILQIRYISNNPLEIYPSNNTRAIFYNCVDISIVAAASNDERNSIENVVVSPASGANISCCSPPQWHATGTETNDLGTITHSIWYDEKIQMVRWDRTGNLETANRVEYLQIITNYTMDTQGNINEYLIYPYRYKCEVYGADAFYPWCYGEVAGQNFVQNYTLNSIQYSEWTNQFNQFTWVSLAETCVPSMMTHLSDQITFTNQRVGKFDPSVFNVPFYCNTSSIEHHSCHTKTQRKI